MSHVLALASTALSIFKHSAAIIYLIGIALLLLSLTLFKLIFYFNQ